MIVDNRYPGDFDIEKYSYSKQTRLQQDSPSQNEDKTGLFGRRVYLESPSFGNKEEEDMYRYVSSRLTDRTASMIDPVAPAHTASRADPTAPAHTGAVLMDSLDFELDILGTTNTRPQIPYVKDTNPAKSQGVQSNHLANIPRYYNCLKYKKNWKLFFLIEPILDKIHFLVLYLLSWML